MLLHFSAGEKIYTLMMVARGWYATITTKEEEEEKKIDEESRTE